MTRPPGTGTMPRLPSRRTPGHWITLVVVVLLIAIPAGYLLLSAHQSRTSGRDKQQTASATGLVWEWPSKATRRIYDVPIPSKSTYVGYFETNTWERSRLYVQFRTSPEKLGRFLDEIGSSRAELRPGERTVSEGLADVVGWDLRVPGHRYAGTSVQQRDYRPDLSVMVDWHKADRPQVYVVSEADF